MIFCCCFYDNFQKYPCIEELAGESFQTIPPPAPHYLTQFLTIAPHHTTSPKYSTQHLTVQPTEYLTQYLTIAPRHSNSPQYFTTVAQRATQYLSHSHHRTPHSPVIPVASQCMCWKIARWNIEQKQTPSRTKQTKASAPLLYVSYIGRDWTRIRTTAWTGNSTGSRLSN